MKWHPYAIGDPSFYSIKKAKGVDFPSRQRGKSAHFILGGAHLTWYTYFPFLLLKRALCDLGPANIERLQKQLVSKEDFLSNISTWDYNGAETWKNDKVKQINPKDIMNDIKEHYHIPWYLECNKLRYPGFYGELDPRIYLPKSAFFS